MQHEIFTWGGCLTRSNNSTFPFNRGLFALFLLVGLYFPTSSGESISPSLYVAAPVVSAMLLTALGLRVGVDEQIILWISTPIVMWLAFCTLLSSNLYEIALMPIAVFCLLALLFSVRVGKLRCGNLARLLAVVSIANVCMGISMLTFDTVAGFMVSHYNNFYDELLPSMITAYKPVLTFATHSVAGTFIYLFFWLNFRTYQKTGKRLHLALALLHLAMCIALMSVTSLAFAVLAVVELVWNFQWISALSAVAAYFLVSVSLKETIGDAFSELWLQKGTGLGPRYGATGNLAGVISYIYHHPFLPIGATYSADLFDSGAQTDSGPLAYFLRGSFILVLLIYGGLFLLLRRNLRDRRDCYRLFFVILAAEVGFTTLTYIRSFLLLPAFMIYLNSLPAASSAQAVRIESDPKPSQNWPLTECVSP